MSFGHDPTHDPITEPDCYVCAFAVRVVISRWLGHDVTTEEAYRITGAMQVEVAEVARGPAA